MILVTLNHTYKNNFDVMDILKGWGIPRNPWTTLREPSICSVPDTKSNAVTIVGTYYYIWLRHCIIFLKSPNFLILTYILPQRFSVRAFRPGIFQWPTVCWPPGSPSMPAVVA